ncbi:hypothetical protein ACFQV8_34890 [Pseudonocardia benzenivorans]
MRLLIDTTHMTFTVGRPFDRRLDDNGVHRLDRRTGARSGPPSSSSWTPKAPTPSP